MPNVALNVIDLESAVNKTELKRLLQILIETTYDTFIGAGVHTVIMDDQEVTLQLSNHLLKRSKEKQPHVLRIEVLDRHPSSQSASQAIYKSTAVILPEQNFYVKTKPIEENHLVKVIFTRGIEDIQAIKDEAEFTQMNPKLQGKPVVFNQQVGFIVYRELPQYSTLLNLLDRTNLSGEERFKLTYEILKAYKNQVYNCGLVHSKISTRSILVNPSNLDVVFSDYSGAVLRPTHGAVQNLRRGTYHLNAPETIAHDIVSTESDSFCLGLVIAEVWGDVSTYTFSSHLSRDQQLLFWAQLKWLQLFLEIDISEHKQRKIVSIIDALTRDNPTERIKLRAVLDCASILIGEESKYHRLTNHFFKCMNGTDAYSADPEEQSRLRRFSF